VLTRWKAECDTLRDEKAELEGGGGADPAELRVLQKDKNAAIKQVRALNVCVCVCLL